VTKSFIAIIVAASVINLCKTAPLPSSMDSKVASISAKLSAIVINSHRHKVDTISREWLDDS
jgi:hypothetical protein